MILKNLRWAGAVILLMVGAAACKKEYANAIQQDGEAVSRYVSTTGTSFVKDTTGYYYKINSAGTGAKIKYSDSVFYSLKLANTDGTQRLYWGDYTYLTSLAGYTDRFTATKAGAVYSLTPIRDVVGRLNYGGAATVVIPAHLAFGMNGVKEWNIGANENLVADIAILPYRHIAQVDSAVSAKFIAANNLQMQRDKYGIYYQVLTPGDGVTPIYETSTVTVNYTVNTLTGVSQDKATAAILTLNNGLINGWRLGLPGKITKGGKIRMLVPSALAYNSGVLDFTIEVTAVTN